MSGGRASEAGASIGRSSRSMVATTLRRHVRWPRRRSTSTHDPAGRDRLVAALDPLGRRLRAVPVRPGAGRHGRVLRGVRVRAGGLGQHDPRHRQERSAAVRRLRRARAEPAGRQSDRARSTRDAQGVVRAGRVDARDHRHGDRRRDGVRAAGRRCRSGSMPGSWQRERIVLGGGSRSWKVHRARRRSCARCRVSRSSRGWRPDPRDGLTRARPVSFRPRDRRPTPVSFRLVTDTDPDRRPDAAAAARDRPARSSTRATTSRPSAARASAASGSSSSCWSSSSS